jgi:hypothetical protein
MLSIIRRIVIDNETLFRPRPGPVALALTRLLPPLACLVAAATRFTLQHCRAAVADPTSPAATVAAPILASVAAAPVAFAADLVRLFTVAAVAQDPGIVTVTLTPAALLDDMINCEAAMELLAADEDEDDDHNDDEDDDEKDEEEEESLPSLAYASCLSQAVQAMLHVVLLGQHLGPESASAAGLIAVLQAALHRHIVPAVALVVAHLRTAVQHVRTSLLRPDLPAHALLVLLRFAAAAADTLNDTLSFLAPVALSPALALALQQHPHPVHGILVDALLAIAADAALPRLYAHLHSLAAAHPQANRLTRGRPLPDWVPGLPGRALAVVGYFIGHRGWTKHPYRGRPLAFPQLEAASPLLSAYRGDDAADAARPLIVHPLGLRALLDAAHVAATFALDDGLEGPAALPPLRVEGAQRLDAVESVLVAHLNLAMHLAAAEDDPSTEAPSLWIDQVAALATALPTLLRLLSLGWDGENRRHLTPAPPAPADDLATTITREAASLFHRLSAIAGQPLAARPCPWAAVSGYVLQHRLPKLQLLLLRLLRAALTRAVDSSSNSSGSSGGGGGDSLVVDIVQPDYAALLDPATAPSLLTSLHSLTSTHCAITHLRFEAARTMALLLRLAAPLADGEPAAAAFMACARAPVDGVPLYRAVIGPLLAAAPGAEPLHPLLQAEGRLATAAVEEEPHVDDAEAPADETQ